MTRALWLADLAKGIAVAAALGLPLAALVLWLMRVAGPLWWLWAWAAWIAFQFLVLALYPTVIAPLFNKFSPLPDGRRARRDRGAARALRFREPRPVRDGRLAPLDPRQRVLHGLRARQAHRVLRHAARAAGARRDRGGARARARPLPAEARAEADAVVGRAVARVSRAPRAGSPRRRGSTRASACRRRSIAPASR